MSAGFRKNLLKICYGGVCFALCLVLPFLTAGNSELGGMLSPMHLPVLICGGVSGPIIGGVVGFFAPILRGVMFGSPAPFIPRALAMAVELFGYGVMMGLLRPIFKKRFYLIYAALPTALVVGKIMGGITKAILLTLGFLPKFGLGIFFTGYFLECIPGMVIQFILVPTVIYALRRAKLDPDAKPRVKAAAAPLASDCIEESEDEMTADMENAD